ncbi:LuxR C-terminal-related transcriptional regulator [Azoarcus sp. DN11]|uniref:LuxR C-terminal-related transcriptional regulator n=1 Tax=Azoarcus sp. DN11 TaxID=356837 RepID=UPI000EB216EB|nr:LuxR C-terminal-related transcriptional regulator [Azoarcus sp. DN11]AYH44650.1 hypothetical protein CDA09_14850 [Azoarcus sp. DN11]
MSKLAPQTALQAIKGVLIVGHPSMQNKLLAALLERRLGSRCVVATLDEPGWPQHSAESVALLDIGLSVDEQIDTHMMTLGGDALVTAIALFNADRDVSSARLLRWPKFKGLFHRDTSEEQLLKGVQAISNNDWWVPRKMLTDYVEDTRPARHLQAGDDPSLTPKELQSLRLMSDGASNADIARSLNVSPHTVKTHIYNLFRKIKVTNRVQAASWAMKNLEPMTRDGK